jgi:hypothetical protein
MGESEMSIISRLMAIRDRMAAQSADASEDGAEPQDAPAANAVDPSPSEPTGVSMWELVAEPPETLPSADPFGLLQGSPGVGFVQQSPLDPPAAESVRVDAEPVRRTGRVRTRLLGIDHSSGPMTTAFEDGPAAEPVSFPVGWLVVVDGPGRGTSFALPTGVSQIGRGDGQAVQLDFGDTAISRESHAAIAYDDEQRAFFVGQGGKANLVRLNGRPVLSTEEIVNGDTLRIGETTLRFVAFCDENFAWSGATGTMSAVNQ